MKASVRLVCCMEKLQFQWISNFWWKIFRLKIPKKLQLWPRSGCLPPSTLLGFMAHSHGLLFYSKRSCWMSFWRSFWAGKRISIAGLSKLAWFNINSCCGVGGLPDQPTPCQFEAAWDGRASYLVGGHLLRYLFWCVVLQKYFQCQ